MGVNGMILDVYPSSKDAEMVDLLYEFERDTRLSLNILVENYLEKLLHDEGYLGNESEKVTKSKTIGEFKKKTCGNGSVKIVCGELVFSICKKENADDLIKKLSEVPPEQLHEFAKNNWNDDNGSYSKFLEAKLVNHSLSITEYLQKKEMKLTTGYAPSKKKYYIHNRNFSFGNYPTEKEMVMVKEYIANLSYDEFQKLKENVLNCGKTRRDYMLEICGGK